MPSFLESLSPEDRQHLENNARPGESYAQAARRLLGSNMEPAAPTLSPSKHRQQDFFVADITDVAPKDDTSSMEHPLFALKAGDTETRRYERNGKIIEIKPGPDGIATIHDKDVWIYCISQLVEAMNRGREVNRTVRFTAYDFLISTNRQVSGQGYNLMADALSRLKGTTIETNIKTNNKRERSGFGLVESWKVIEHGENEKMVSVEVTLPEWLFRSVQTKQVLTLNKDYFRIRKPINRRVYEIARKHCGSQSQWRVTIKTLLEKSGSRDQLRKFRAKIKALAKENDLPGYLVTFDQESDSVTFQARAKAKA